MKINDSSNLFFFSFIFFLLSPSATESKPPKFSKSSSILFSTQGRLSFEFDIFTLPTTRHRPPSPSQEHRITDGVSINYNGHFASPSPALISLLPKELQDPSLLHLIYVTERIGGIPSLHYDAVRGDDYGVNKTFRFQIPLLTGEDEQSGMMVNSMKDKPVLTNEHLVYVSTHEDPGKPMASWTAIYSTELRTKLTRRLTPPGIADFSPAVSPSGKWTAVASYGERGWNREAEELSTDIYIFLTRDGTQRVKVIELGGWPSWVNDSTLYFHRKSKDGWISIYRAILPKSGSISTESVTIRRVTPPGLHAFTPATSPNNHDFIAVATRRPETEIRHVELFDLKKNEFVELTRLVSPKSHHLNPFLSPGSSRVGYHSCRGDATGRKSPRLFLQKLKSNSKDLSIFRVDGDFPSVSPDGNRIAFVTTTSTFVANSDGSDLRQLLPQLAFGTVWDPIRPGIIYTSSDPTLIRGRTKIDILAINVDATNQSTAIRKLTTNGKSNAFPWPSPDGKQIVFRSRRSGHNNIYIMDAEKGESGGLFRLTNGAWEDTLATWSPDGNWIVIGSNREFPGTLNYNLFVVHPNGTGLRKVTSNLTGVVSMHPIFSPDSKRIVFTTIYAGISSEPIGSPFVVVPSGEIFTVKLDGSDLRRITHNSYEDGPAMWASKINAIADVAWPKRFGPNCVFEDFKSTIKP